MERVAQQVTLASQTLQEPLAVQAGGGGGGGPCLGGACGIWWTSRGLTLGMDAPEPWD